MHCIVAAIALALMCGVAANTTATMADSAIYPGDHAPGVDRVEQCIDDIWPVTISLCKCDAGPACDCRRIKDPDADRRVRVRPQTPYGTGHHYGVRQQQCSPAVRFRPLCTQSHCGVSESACAHDLLLCRPTGICGTAATRCTSFWRRARPTTRASCS